MYRKYDPYGGFGSQTEIRLPTHIPIAPYRIQYAKDMKGLRDKVGEMIIMDDFKDIKDVAGRLYDIAMDLSDMGVDISEGD